MINGMTLPDYREGDQVQPGRTVSEVHAVEEMEAQAKVNELDRAYLATGQSVEIRVDGLADMTFNGKLKTMAALATRRFFDFDAARQFDVIFDLDKPDARVRPGVSVEVTILGDAVKDALFLPRQAVFEKDGKSMVYAATGKAFEQREVRIVRRTESQVVIDGLAEGTEVALVKPEEEAQKPAKADNSIGILR